MNYFAVVVESMIIFCHVFYNHAWLFIPLEQHVRTGRVESMQFKKYITAMEFGIIVP